MFKNNFYYYPRLPNGRKAPLTWQMKLLRSSPIAWPLAEEAPRWVYFLELFYCLISFGLFGFLHFSNFYYVYLKYHNTFDIIQIIPTYLAMTEAQVRHFHTMFRKTLFKSILKTLYSEIYVMK